LLVMVMVAFTVTPPVPVGPAVKVTLSWQVPPGATGLLHVPIATLNAALPAVLATFVMVSGAPPVLVTSSVVVVVLLTGRLPKLMFARVPIVGTTIAVPVRLAVAVPPVLVTTSDAVFG